MNIVDIEKCCWIYVGRDVIGNARLAIFIGFGFREDAEPGETVFRHFWKWSSASLPYVIWRRWRPIGFCAFGRCRMFCQ